MYQGILYYNSNGNLIQDLNKKISEIQYNCLNLRSCIEFEDGGVISYLYDAKGIKFRTTHIIAGKTTTTDYFDDAIYENGVLTGRNLSFSYSGGNITHSNPFVQSVITAYQYNKANGIKMGNGGGASTVAIVENTDIKVNVMEAM